MRVGEMSAEQTSGRANFQVPIIRPNKLASFQQGEKMHNSGGGVAGAPSQATSSNGPQIRRHGASVSRPSSLVIVASLATLLWALQLVASDEIGASKLAEFIALQQRGLETRK